MINRQNYYKKYKSIIPLYLKYKYGFPIIRKDNFDYDCWNQNELCSFKDIKIEKDKENSIVIMFNYEESFSNNKKIHEQLSFFPIDKVFKNEMGDYHGK